MFLDISFSYKIDTREDFENYTKEQIDEQVQDFAKRINNRAENIINYEIISKEYNWEYS